MRPVWCPHKNCKWITGGGTSTDSGMMCCGKLENTLTHGHGENTHRMCFKPFDQTPTSYEINKTDVWYFFRVLKTMAKKLGIVKEV